MIAIDSSVLIDLLADGPHADAAEACLRQCLSAGPVVVCDVALAEVCGSLREALESLDKDRAFLKKGGVMDDDFIDSYIELKMEEVMRLQLHPHPVEFDMYYSC